MIRCTIKSACQNATWSFGDRSSPRWLSLETQQCIDFQSVIPEHLPLNSMHVVSYIVLAHNCLTFQPNIKSTSFIVQLLPNYFQVELVINQLPQLPYGAHYLCVFGDNDPIPARVNQNGLSCMSPLVTARPTIRAGKGKTLKVMFSKRNFLEIRKHSLHSKLDQ